MYYILLENQRREAMYKYWSRDDRIQLPEKHEEKDGTLIIYNIQPGDGGKYTCNTVNGRGQSKRGKTIKLKIIGMKMYSCTSSL